MRLRNSGFGSITTTDNSNDDTAKGDVINDVRSQQRPDVTNSPIEDSTSGPNNVSVTGTGTESVTVQTPESETTVNRTQATTSDGNTPDNTPQNTPTVTDTNSGGDMPDIDGGMVAAAVAVFVLVGAGVGAVIS